MKTKILIVFSLIVLFSTSIYAQNSAKFLADSLAAINYSLGKNTLFLQIQENKEFNIALECFADNFKIKAKNNSEVDLKGKNSGIFVNLDLYENQKQNVRMGMLIRYDVLYLEQSSNKSDVQDIGLGGYIGWFNYTFDIKGSVRFGYQTYVNQSEGSKSEFSGMSAFADIEAKYKIFLKEYLILKPFAALDFGFNMNDSFMENSGTVNLDVDKNTYFRAQSELGVGLESVISDLLLYCDAGVNFLLAGKENEIKTKTPGYEKIKSSKYDEIFYRLSLGGEYNISETIGFYLNAGYRLSQNYNDLYGNIGISYKIGY